jgi:periplasmic divalent cation tolerance protein
LGPEIALFQERTWQARKEQKGCLEMAVARRKKPAAQVLVVMVTVKNLKEAVRIGEEMVHMKLAACANVIPGIQSIYRWKGKVAKAQEALLILKSTTPRYRALEKAITTMHTYEVPEVIALPVTKGLETYIRWVRVETHG